MREMQDFLLNLLLNNFKKKFLDDFNCLLDFFRSSIAKVEENERERIIQIFLLLITNEANINIPIMKNQKERLPLFSLSNKREFDKKLENSVFFTIDNQTAGYVFFEGMLVTGQILDKIKKEKIYHEYENYSKSMIIFSKNAIFVKNLSDLKINYEILKEDEKNVIF